MARSAGTYAARPSHANASSGPDSLLLRLHLSPRRTCIEMVGYCAHSAARSARNSRRCTRAHASASSLARATSSVYAASHISISQRGGRIARSRRLTHLGERSRGGGSDGVTPMAATGQLVELSPSDGAGGSPCARNRHVQPREAHGAPRSHCQLLTAASSLPSLFPATLNTS